MIYLDNAATSYYKPFEVKQAVNKALNLYTANAGRGGYKLANMCAEKIYEVREKVLKFFNANNHTCIFTSGCSSALNLAILGTVKQGGHVVVSFLEHNSVLRPLEYLKSMGKIDYTIVKSDKEDDFERAIKPNTYMMITTQASNITGQRLKIKNFNNICKKYKILHLVDTAQGAGHIFDDLNYVDMIAFAGHKGLLGIGGIGGLVVSNNVILKPIMFGGTGTFSESLIQPTDKPEGFEVGTMPIIPIISLGAGIDYVVNNKQYILQKEKKLNEYLMNKLKELDFIIPYFNSSSADVYSFNIKGLDSSFVSDILDERFNICTRSGLHCAPLVHKYLGTQNIGAVRVSVNSDNSFEDIDKLIFALKKIKDI